MNQKYYGFGIFVFLFCWLGLITCNGQPRIQYKKINYQRKYKIVPTKVLNAAVDITSYLPVGFKRDASIDYTVYLQRALNENRVVLFPNFPILVNKNGLNISSNSKLIFQQKSRLIMKPNAEKMFAILEINRKKNIQIFNPYLQGDKDSHLGIDGQWGMGVNIISSSNIQIYEPFIIDNWGDGIYLGNRSNGDNVNVTISGGLLDNNRRNGISVISASNLYIENLLITNTFGTLPMAGIDIEPNDASSKINNINLTNVKVFNSFTGFQITLNYYGSKIINQLATININDLNISDVTKGVYVTGFKNKPAFKAIKGQFTLSNISTDNVNQPFVVEKHFQSYPNIKVKNYNFNMKGKSYKNDPNMLLKNVATQQGITYN